MLSAVAKSLTGLECSEIASIGICEVVHFTIIHLAGTYILKQVKNHESDFNILQ